MATVVTLPPPFLREVVRASVLTRWKPAQVLPSRGRYVDGRRDQAQDGIATGKSSRARPAWPRTSRSYDLAPSEIESWVKDGRKGLENALKAKPQDVRKQCERQLKELQEAYGKAMQEQRARKNCSPCWWARTRSDRDDPPGTAGRWHYRLDLQAVPLVWCAQAHRVLPPSQGCAKVAGSIGGADQGHDRGEPILRLSNGGASAGVQPRVQFIFQIKG